LFQWRNLAIRVVPVPIAVPVVPAVEVPAVVVVDVEEISKSYNHAL